MLPDVYCYKTSKNAVRTIPGGKESSMEQNEADKDPAARNQDPSGADTGSVRRPGSNKVVIAIWVMFLLGGSCLYTYARQRNAAEAERLLNEAYMLYGRGELSASTELLRQSAELGNAWAQLYYGERLKTGFGTEQNLAESVKWLRKSAKRRCPEAFYQLGVSYENGEGVERDPNKAAAWYRKALADPGFSASAQSALDRIERQKSAGDTNAN